MRTPLLRSLKLAVEFLGEGGTFVASLWESRLQQSVVGFGQLFEAAFFAVC